MSLNLAALGVKLASLRSNAGLTQDEVAKRLGVSRAAVIHTEGGQRAPNALELADLANLYRVSLGDLMSAGAMSPSDPLVALGRLAPEVTHDPVAGEAVRSCLAICQEGVALETVLERPVRSGPPAYEGVLRGGYADAALQGQDAAEQERRRLGLSDNPIVGLPQVISAQGIWVAETDFPDGVSGLFLHHSSVGIVVLVNRAHSFTRRRFSYAHEYAHALFDRDLEVQLTSKQNSNELRERRANAFAASFLLPRRGVEKLLTSLNAMGSSRISYSSYDAASGGHIEAERRLPSGSQIVRATHVAAVAHRFGVSYAATCYRLFELGYVNRQELSELMNRQDAAAALGDALGLGESTLGKDDQTCRADLELVRQVALLAIDAFQRQLITKKRLLEISDKLPIPREQLLQFANDE